MFLRKSPYSLPPEQYGGGRKRIFIGLMLDWIKDEMKQNPETLVNRFALVIQDDVSCALNRFRVDRGNSASNPAD